MTMHGSKRSAWFERDFQPTTLSDLHMTIAILTAFNMLSLSMYVNITASDG